MILYFNFIFVLTFLSCFDLIFPFYIFLNDINYQIRKLSKYQEPYEINNILK